MGQRYPVRVIAHVHTRASNGPASEMDPMIAGAIRDTLGEDSPVRWRECFTPVSRIRRLLDDDAGAHRVGLILLTDHMNAVSHVLSEEVQRAAAEDPRVAACAEVACVDRDVDGEYRKSPEVLVYGRAVPEAGPFGPQHGLTQAILDDVFETCRAPGGRAPTTTGVLRYCAERGIACALAHPFDGHDLSPEGTFDVLSRARFIETVNGGFPAVSARILEDWIRFQNRVAAGWRLAPATALRWPLARRLADRIAGEERAPLHPWGGSDAHERNFDRVVVRFLAERPDPTAGELFRVMVDRSVETLLADGTFSVHGDPGLSASLVVDIVRIVAKNLWWNRAHFLNPVVTARVVRRTHAVVAGELGRRSRRQAELVRAVRSSFDASAVLGGMVAPVPERAAGGRRAAVGS
jgi:hypothetical protein